MVASEDKVSVPEKQMRTEDALRLSEQKFEALFQGMPFPVYTWQRSGEDFALVDHNAAADAITGGKIGDFLGMSATAMYPDRPDIVADISRCFAEKVSIQREMEYQFKTTGERKVLVVDYAFVPPDLVLVQTQDVTERVRAQEEAVYERDLMRTLLDKIPDYVYFKDRDRRFVRASNAFCGLFKLELDAIIGKRDEELFPPEVAAETIGDDLRVIEMGIPLIDKEEGGESVGGEPHWVLTTKLPWYDADGDIIGLFGISREITQRVQAERALRRERDLVSRIMDTSPVGITVFDQQGRITFANALVQQEAALLGEPELEGLSYKDLSWQIMTVDGRPLADEEHPFARVMNTRQSIHDARYAVEGQDGGRLFISVNASPLFDEAGQISGVVTTADDISARVRAQAELQASEEKHRDLVEQISDVIYAVDASGVITYLNPAIEALIGLPPEQVVGQTFARFIHPEDLGRVKGNVQNLLAGRVPGPAEYRVLNESGETRWIGVTSQPIVDGGRVSGIQGVLTDITERKRLEEQLAEEAIAAERQRLARELHDSVSQTLYSASLIAQAVQRMWERDSEECQRGLEQLERFIQGALAEMRTLLLELHPASLEDENLPVLLRQLADAAMVRTPAIVTTTVMGECTLPNEVKVALYRIAQEALRNVVKYAGARRVRVNLQCPGGAADARDGAQTILSIQDDGAGFDPEDAQPPGLGLGIMRDRAREIGATFSLTSQPDVGTEVLVAWQDMERKP